MLIAFLSRLAARLSIGHFKSPQSHWPLIKHVVVEITPSGAEA
jgi:hypothetical protein